MGSYARRQSQSSSLLAGGQTGSKQTPAYAGGMSVNAGTFEFLNFMEFVGVTLVTEVM